MYTKEFRFETSFKWPILLQIVFFCVQYTLRMIKFRLYLKNKFILFFQYRKKQLYFKENLWIDYNQIVYSHL